MQNRERTGVPKRTARLGWWMRPDATLDDDMKHSSGFNIDASIRSLPLSVLQWLHLQLEFAYLK